MTYWIEPEGDAVARQAIIRSTIRTIRKNIGEDSDHTSDDANHMKDPVLDSLFTERNTPETQEMERIEKQRHKGSEGGEEMRDQLEMEDEERYTMSQILAHLMDGNTIMFKVKYQGET